MAKNQAAEMSNKSILHVAMYPWFAMGHLTPFLHLSNKLAERSHRISLFIPRRTQQKLTHFNHFPELISFIPIDVPEVDGLPKGSETTADIPYPLQPLLMAAMDMTEPEIESALRNLKPNVVLLDFTHWLPSLARKLGIKSIHYCIVSPATIGFLACPARKLLEEKITEADLMEPPTGFPPSGIKLLKHEARGLLRDAYKEYGREVSLTERLLISLSDCDAIMFKACREMEGMYADYVESQFKKPVILAGPVVPEAPKSFLDKEMAGWLGKFKEKSVIYCAFGSECEMEIDQFQELVLGFELTGTPFLAALKPPIGTDSIDSALPIGFKDRTEGRGRVLGGWVQQQLILAHPSIGCFVTHCGSGSLSESLVNECQLVFLPNVGDQIIKTRMMAKDFKVGVEVERGEEGGLFTRNGVCKAIKSVMDEDSKVGNKVRANHAKWRLLLSKGLESSYIDNLVLKMQGLLE